jgi:hypothetical protein
MRIDTIKINDVVTIHIPEEIRKGVFNPAPDGQLAVVVGLAVLVGFDNLVKVRYPQGLGMPLKDVYLSHTFLELKDHTEYKNRISQK